MPRPKFKQRCAMCKDNMVIIFSHRQFPICVDCHMKRITKPVTEKAYKFLNISNDLYKQSTFLRNIKESYQRFDKLSEKQIDAFKKVVKELKNPPKEEAEVDVSKESSESKEEPAQLAKKKTKKSK